ncbi:MAG: hypothetical protein IIY81_11550 [Lachnospiraceae bacterium]|nr:hypothetical protein [Lachnospiraceae bacterium]
MEKSMEDQDVLVIEDNTIYEIDMQCMHCKKGGCKEQNKKMKKYEKKKYDEWTNKKL